MTLGLATLAPERAAGETDTMADLADCNVYIVTVPTPIDKHKQPDLRPLESASTIVGKVIGSGDVVVYESTVYPAVPRRCAHQSSRLSQRSRTTKISMWGIARNASIRVISSTELRRYKVTSGSTPEAADLVDALYPRTVTAGKDKTSSIRFAEASNIIEISAISTLRSSVSWRSSLIA